MSDCVHHWLIEPAEGPVSEGVCEQCGERREFSNVWSEEMAWKQTVQFGVDRDRHRKMDPLTSMEAVA